MFAVLTCFIFSGSLLAFGAEQQGKAEGYSNQKVDYQKQMEIKRKELKQKLEEMKVKAADLKKESRAKFDKDMKALDKEVKALDKKMFNLKTASEKTWKKMKIDLDKTMDDLDRHYERMMAHFSNT